MCSACQPREVRAGSCCGAANLFNCCFGNVIALGRSPQQEGLIHSCEWAELWAPGHRRAGPRHCGMAGPCALGRATGHTGASGTLGTGRSPRLVHVRPLPWMGGSGLGPRPADTYLVWETLWPVPWLHLVPTCAHSHTAAHADHGSRSGLCTPYGCRPGALGVAVGLPGGSREEVDGTPSNPNLELPHPTSGQHAENS